MSSAKSSVQKKLSPGQIERAASLFSALAETSRLRLLQALMRGGEMTVGELVKATALTQANVSKHLGALRAARLVSKERQGMYAHYRIADPLVPHLCALVCGKIERDAKRELASLSADE